MKKERKVVFVENAVLSRNWPVAVLIASIILLSFVLLGCSKDDGDGPINGILTILDFEGSIDENPTAGDEIGTVDFSFENTDLPDLSIVSQSVGGAVVIDAASGKLTVGDPTAFDFEERQSMTGVIRIETDSENAEANFSIEINDVDDYENEWVQMEDFPGGARRSSFVMATETAVYVGMGYDGNDRKDDFWEFDLASGTWSEKEAFGGGVRLSGVAFAIDGVVYAGMGSNNTSQPFDDFWKFEDDTWTELADVSEWNAGERRQLTASMVYGGKAYVIGGSGSGSLYDEVLRYDPSTDTWEEMSDPPFGPRDYAVTFVIEDTGYVTTGSGDEYFADTWAYDFATDTWTQKSDYPGKGRYSVVGFALGKYAYVGFGIDDVNDEYQDDFWKYDPELDTWTEIGEFSDIGGRFLPIGIAVGGQGYVGLGQVNGETVADWWQYWP